VLTAAAPAASRHLLSPAWSPTARGRRQAFRAVDHSAAERAALFFAVVAGVQTMALPALADADPAVLTALLAPVFRHLVDAVRGYCSPVVALKVIRPLASRPCRYPRSRHSLVNVSLRKVANTGNWRALNIASCSPRSP